MNQIQDHANGKNITHDAEVDWCDVKTLKEIKNQFGK